MALLRVIDSQVGLVGVDPQIIFIETTDTYTAVTTPGYLNPAKTMGYTFTNNQMALVTTSDSGVMFLEVSVATDGLITLNPAINPGTVLTPTIANHIATYYDTAGTLTEDPTIALTNFSIQALDGHVYAGNSAGSTNHSLVSFSGTASKGSLRITASNNAADYVVSVTNASHGQATTLTIPDGGQATSNFIISNSTGTQTIATGNLTLTNGTLSVTTGNIQAGDGDIIAGKTTGSTSNSFISYTPTATSGSLRLKAANNSGNYDLTITNGSHNQSTVLTIPDGAQAASNFIISNSNVTQHISTGGLQIDVGSVSIGTSAGTGSFALNLYPPTGSRGQLSIIAANNSGDFPITITNASHGQTTTYTIPNCGDTVAKFIVSTFPTVQVIDQGDLQVAQGDFIAGASTGSGGGNSFISYSVNSSSGSLKLSANNNAGNFITTITQAPQSLSATYSIPYGGVAASNFIISNSTGTQTIDTGSLQLVAGSVFVGSSAGGGVNGFIIYPSAATSGQLKFICGTNAGDYAITVTNASHGQASIYTIPDGGQAASNFIISNSTGTQSIDTGSLSIASPGDMYVLDGNFEVGNAGGCTRNGFFSYSTTAAMGKTVFAARDNAGDFLVRFSNQSHAQDSEYLVPDSGQATSNFIVSNHPTTQYIATGDLEVVAGSFNVGDPAGAAGLHYIRSYPATAATGYLGLLGIANAGDYPILIQNVAMGQSTTFRLPDPGVANAVFVVNGAVDPVPPSNLIYKTFFTEINYTALAAGGFATLQPSDVAGVWGVVDITINNSSQDFAGGGGDRDIAIESYTGAAPAVVYSVIPTATLTGGIPNARWGDAALPAPSGYDYMTQWGGGDTLVAKYSGGTTDYTTGGVLKLAITLVQVS